MIPQIGQAWKLALAKVSRTNGTPKQWNNLGALPDELILYCLVLINMKYVLIMLIVLISAAALYFKDQVLLSPHDSYYSALLRENLKVTAEQWKMDESPAAPPPISLPYSERRLLEADYLQPITFVVDRKTDELIQVNIFPSINFNGFYSFN